MNQSLLEKLQKYGESDFYPFHMPGHKRRDFREKFPNPYRIDITEIDGFDNLHHPEGILKDSMEETARIYGADKSYYLVNGSTCGILSAVCSCVRNGRRILMARNCHKAAYHAAILQRLDVEYVYPKYLKEYGFCGGISAEDVREILEKTNNCRNYVKRMAADEDGCGPQDAKIQKRIWDYDADVENNAEDCGKLSQKIAALLIVSPTYEGVLSDIQAIADVAHEYGIPLIVDEAHGAHFPFGAGSGFPKSALDCGADVVIQSLHKTLPSFTQTAILHVKGDLVKPEQMERYLGMFQTSSPSYVFLAGIERCIRFMDGVGRREMEQYACRLKNFYERMQSLRRLRVVNPEICKEPSVFDWDMSKIMISNLNGNILSNLLREKYHLEVEMRAWNYVIAMTSVMDTDEGMERLADALKEIDRELESGCLNIWEQQDGELKKENFSKREDLLDGQNEMCQGGIGDIHAMCDFLPPAVSKMSLAKALEADSRRILLSESSGMISAEFVYLYPPGIPIVAPGETVTEEIVRHILWHRDHGFSIQGLSDLEASSILTVADK